jgi:hypothetical protein
MWMRWLGDLTTWLINTALWPVEVWENSRIPIPEDNDHDDD